MGSRFGVEESFFFWFVAGLFGFRVLPETPNPKTLNPFNKMLLSPLKDLHDTSCAFYEDLRDPEDLENREREWLRGKDFVGLEKAPRGFLKQKRLWPVMALARRCLLQKPE